MAFPTVPTVASGDLLSSTTAAAGTTHTFPNLSSLRGGAGPQAGDLLIAIIVQYQGGTLNAEYSSWGASFTELRDDATVTALDMAVGIAYKIAAGTESGTFNVTSAHSFISAQFLLRIPAGTWHGTTVPEALASVRATNAAADPGSFDPTNWAAEDTLWIAVGGFSETTTTGSPPTLDTPPTNYTGQLIVARGADAVGNVTAGVAFRQLNASAEDVGTWGVSNPTHGNGIATVIAVRPALVVTKTQSATARISVTATKTQAATARVQATVTKTQSATAKIVQPFPLTSLLDNFNRASLGSTDWQTPWLNFAGSFSIASSTILAPSSTSSAGGWKTVCGPDCEAWVQVPTLPAAGQYIGVVLRGSTISNVSGSSRYDLRLTPSTSSWQINRVVTGTPTAIGTFTHALSAGDWIGLRSIGGVISAYWSSDGVNWVLVGIVDDSGAGFATTPGYIGVQTNDSTDTVRFDNFGGGSTGAITKTQSAIARIQITTTKTQAATARVQATVTKTQGALARISASSTKTQSATGRISAPVTKTQGAVARIAATATKTQSAIARIAKSFTKTQSATARIQLVFTKTQTAVARIQTSQTKTQSATARITATVTKTQSALARIAKSFTKDQSATARVQVTGTKTQAATARVQKTFTKTQAATAFIVLLVTKTQSAVARIQLVSTKTQSAVARVAVEETKTQTATARVTATVTKTQGATGRVQTTATKTQIGTARIEITSTKTQSAVARIQISSTKTQTATARVSATVTKTQPATALIVTSGTVTKTQTARAAIRATATTTQSAVARIAVTGTKTQSATARIQIAGTKTQSAVARIRIPATKTQQATARIRISATKTQPAVARISATRTKTQTATARIAAAVFATTQTATARISKSFTKTQSASARISAEMSSTQSATARIVPFVLVYGGGSVGSLPQNDDGGRIETTEIGRITQ
jgi:hypothetical protein